MKKSRKLLWLLYQPYKWLVFLPLLGISSCFFVAIGFILLMLFDEKTANSLGVGWARFNSYITPVRVKVIGRENIKKGQSYVIVSNHQSLFDIIVLFGWLLVDIKWVIKEELKKFPVLSFAANKGGQIWIDRSNPKAAYESLLRAKDKLTGGTSLMVFPEGTRSRSGDLGEFKKGAFRAAVALGLPILPITIINTNKILPPGTLDLFPGRAVMEIHAPVHTSGYDERSLEGLIGEVRAIIKKGLEDHALDQRPRSARFRSASGEMVGEYNSEEPVQ
jgi:1-acyl-sn-glycerol-3-phosphate acyltransferase